MAAQQYCTVYFLKLSENHLQGLRQERKAIEKGGRLMEWDDELEELVNTVHARLGGDILSDAVRRVIVNAFAIQGQPILAVSPIAELLGYTPDGHTLPSDAFEEALKMELRRLARAH